MKNGDMPANPIDRDMIAFDPKITLPPGYTMGLTKREEFAIRLMAALQTACGTMISDKSGIEHMAEIAIKQANALLDALEKGGDDDFKNKKIATAFEAAKENGYNLNNMSETDIAEELINYDSGFENEKIDDLIVDIKRYFESIKC